VGRDAYRQQQSELEEIVVEQGPGDQTQAIPPTPGPTTPPPRVGPPAWVLADRYRVLDRLGTGGMADVFRAHDELLDRDVAVKVFRTPVDEPGNATAVERREIELRALAQLSHPNLITLYDANIVAADPAFLVTELVIGPNLATRLTDGPLPEDLVRTVGTQIAEALAYVHASGMVHRDVKPANILLGTDGPTPETATIRARLSDFGIVRVLEDARMTSAELTLGTAYYLAPEQARGADVTAAADVYSLGLVLIEMLTGERSFDGPMHEAMAARLSRGPHIPAGLPQPWPGLLAAMTQLDPAARPTAAEVAESLRMSTSTFAAAPVPVPVGIPAAGAFAAAPLAAGLDSEPLPAPHRRRGVGMAIAALAFIAVIATAVILITRPSSDPTTPTGGGTTPPPTSTGQPSRVKSGKSGNDAAVPVTAGGSTASSGRASSGAASSAVSSASRTKTKSAPRTRRPSSSTRPSTSAPRPTPTRRTSPAPSTPATSAAPTTSVPVSGGAASGGAAISSAAP
jgi:serine/threonine protein kinase